MSLLTWIERLIIASASNRHWRALSPPDEPERGTVLLGRRRMYDVGAEGGPVYLQESDCDCHMHLIGSSGCGKTSGIAVIVKEAIKAKRTILVIDRRGDLTDQLVRLTIGALGEQVARDSLALIDLRQDDYVVGCNPLAVSPDPFASAFLTLDIIRAASQSWGVQIDECSRFALIALAQARLSLVELEPFLVNQAFREQTLTEVTDRPTLSFWERFGEMSAERQLSWAIPVTNKFSGVLSFPRTRYMLAGVQNLDWKRLLDQPGNILLISLGVDRLGSAGDLIGSLIVAMIRNIVVARVDQPQSDRNPVWLILDEFEAIAAAAYETILAEGRRFRLSLYLAHQNLSQIAPTLRDLIRHNARAGLYFQTGSGDASDLANDINGLGNKEAVRQLILSQEVGQAVLTRRGQPSVPINLSYEPIPNIEQAVIRSVRESALKKYGRPKRQVIRRIEERLQAPFRRRVRDHGIPGEVRHGQRPQLPDA